MSALIDDLKAYGADTEGAMERLVDDEELYMTCLVSFKDDPCFPALDQAFSSKDYKVAFEQAHALKGVAGNLGLTPLYTSICNLVEALRASEFTQIDTLKGWPLNRPTP